MSLNTSITEIELEVIEGLETIAHNELLQRCHREIKDAFVERGRVRFRYTGIISKLLTLGTIVSVYTVTTHPVPRPRGLLGHQHFTRLMAQIENTFTLNDEGAFKTFFISAAGSDSSVMQRIRDEIARHTGLSPVNSGGDLLIRIRPTANKEWETLVRVTPRPLATRSWRIANMEGALNASVARAMAILSEPSEDDIVLNIACGSGSLLIERCVLSRPLAIVGCDNALQALKLSKLNISASHHQQTIQLLQADASCLPFGKGYFNKLLADLPFGQLVGNHQDNKRIYPQILAEAGRITVVKSLFVLITHEIRLIETILRQTSLWHIRQTVRINLNGLHPRIYVLERA